MPVQLRGDPVARHADVLALLVRYTRFDQMFIVAGTIFVLVMYVVAGLDDRALVVAFTMTVLAVMLELVARLIAHGEERAGLLLACVGHWAIAVAVAVLVAWLWPVMVVVSVSPAVLVTPFVRAADWVKTAATSVVIVVCVAVVGRHGPGVDFDAVSPVWQTSVIAIGLVAGIAPLSIGLWNNHRLIRDGFDRMLRLNTELSTSEAELAASRRRVVDATDNARRQIEQDIHDGAQQRLLALSIRLQVLQQTAGAIDTSELGSIELEIRRAIEELRELAHGVYPPMLKTDGLAHAIEAIAQRSSIPTTVTLCDVGDLDDSIVTAVYFSTLEAVSNASKYAPGASLEIRLTHTSSPTEELQFEICDDGPGFDRGATSRTLGLTTMQDRVKAIGGTLVIETEPGQGTTVSARIPLRDQRAVHDKPVPVPDTHSVG